MDGGDKNIEVFSVISQIMLDTDFDQAQHSFMEANFEKFESGEEEAVHKDFVALMESKILQDAKQKVSSEEISAFYSCFMDDQQKFEEINSGTSGNLQMLLDIKIFKDAMTLLKDAGGEDTNGATNMVSMESEKDAWAKFQSLLNEDVKVWKRKVTQKNFNKGLKVQMYQKKSKGGPDWLKTEAEIQGKYPKSKLMIDICVNPGKEDLAQFKEFKVLSQTENSCIIYYRFKMPMMSDRDTVTQVTQKEMENGDVFGQTTTIDHPDYPQVKGCVRMSMNSYYMYSDCKEQADTLLYKECSQLDFGGNMPKSVMSSMLVSESQKDLRKTVDAFKVRYA